MGQYNNIEENRHMNIFKVFFFSFSSIFCKSINTCVLCIFISYIIENCDFLKLLVITQIFPHVFWLNISCRFKTFANCTNVWTGNLITQKSKGTINESQCWAIKVVTKSGLIFHNQFRNIMEPCPSAISCPV